MDYQIVNGKLVTANEARIPLNDLGLLRSYSVFDYFRVLDGVPVFIEDHVDRLLRSAKQMHLHLQWSREDLLELCHKLIDANKVLNAGLRIVITGGFSEDGYNPAEPNLYMTLGKLPEYDPSDFTKGRGIISSEYQRDMPGVKTTIYVHSIQLAQKIREANAAEVLYHVNGVLSECSRSNIFFLTREGDVITPASNMLYGITRKRVIKLFNEHGIRVHERDIVYDEIRDAAECFITSSTKTILPVVRIDDIIIGSGDVGEMTKQMYDWFQEHIRQYVAERKAPAS